MDVPTADAFVRQVFRGAAQASYSQAAAIYLDLIAHWGERMDDGDAELIQRHADQALLVVPEALRQELRGAPSPGEALAAWWAQQDPLPASPLNERLIEHLVRVAYAEHHFSHPRSPLRFDARGEVFVRLGEPGQRRAIDYFRPDLVRRIHELRVAGGNSLLVSPSSFASSEVWYYHGGQPYHYLFVSDGRVYKVGEVPDIIPQHLRGAIDGGTGRGGAKADLLLEVLRTVYRQLAPFDINYVQRLHEVDTYLGQLEDLAQEEAAQFADRTAIGASHRVDYSAVAQRRGASLAGRNTPDLAARSFVEAARREDYVLRALRDERAPESQSSVLDGIEPLALATRAARFLNPDGSTRAEIYWAPEPAALPLSRELQAAAGGQRLARYPDQVLRATVVRNAAKARRQVEQIHYHSLSARAVRSPEPMLPQTLVADSLQGGDDLAVQWDQLVAALGEGGPTLGPRARLAVLRTETFAPLRADGRLEMSDLKPVVGPTEIPHPFESVRTDMPLALYFEAYGLTFGPEDEVNFAVEYEVTLRREGGLLRRSREETTSGNLLSTIRGTRTEQYLILNPGAWTGATGAEVTVTVRDRTTGGSVTRSVSFEVEGNAGG